MIIRIIWFQADSIVMEFLIGQLYTFLQWINTLLQFPVAQFFFNFVLPKKPLLLRRTQSLGRLTIQCSSTTLIKVAISCKLVFTKFNFKLGCRTALCLQLQCKTRSSCMIRSSQCLLDKSQKFIIRGSVI